MKFAFLKHRWQRITARILVILTAVILVAGLLINVLSSPILGRTVKKMVLNSSDGLYNVNFTDADLHIFQEKIVITNIDLEPDMASYNARKKLNIAPNNLYHLHIKKLVLTYINPIQLFFKRKLNIDEIVLSAPELKITYQLNHTSDTTEKDNRTLYQRISKTLRSIHVGHIGLNDVKFKYEDHSGNKVAISEFKELNLSAMDLLIDSASMTDKSRFLYCSDVVTEINNFSGKTLNGLYQYNTKHIKLSSRKAQLTAEDMTLTPVQPDVFFKKSHQERFTVHIDSMALNNFDFLTYHKYRKLTATSLALSKGTIAVYANPNPNPQLAKVNRWATFPNAGIYKLKTDMKIDSVLLQHINVIYTELNAKSLKTGSVIFNNTSGEILNLSTNAEALKKNKICNVSLITYLMNRGKLDVHLKFDMADKNLAYSYSGHMGPMDINVINPAVMPLAMVKINSGTLKSFDFDIHADVNQSQGKVAVLYNDLKITVLKPDTANDKLKRMTIASLFANIFIIKHNNPDADGRAARSFMVNYQRPPESPFFKTVWRTLLIGIRSCAGYGEKKEKEVKTQIAVRATKKEERIQKRAERKERRAERKQKRAEKKLQKEMQKQQQANHPPE